MKEVRVLLVEDSKIDLTTAKFYLEGLGLAVDTAEDGFQALSLMNQFSYDLFVIDLVMPRMNGFALIPRIKAKIEYKDIPLIVVSSKNGIHDINRVVKLGINDFIIKPINPKLLEDKVKVVIKGLENKNPEIPLPGKTQERIGEFELNRKVEFMSLNEVGLTIKSKTGLQIGEVITLNSKLFESIGLRDVSVRIGSFVMIDSIYYIKVKFCSLSKEEIHNIRLYLANKRTYAMIPS